MSSGRPSPPTVLEYTVYAPGHLNELEVSVNFPPGTPGNWSVDPEASQYLDDIFVRPGNAATDLPWSAASERSCRTEGCEVRYVFYLRRAATELDTRMVAAHFGSAIISPSSTWLLRPKGNPENTMLRYRVRTEEGISFGTGTPPVPGATDTFESVLPRGFHAPYAAFGPMQKSTIHLGKQQLAVFVLSSDKVPRQAEYIEWVQGAGQAIAGYYGRFPAEYTAVFLLPFPYHGSQMGIGGASIVLGMDPRKSPSDSGRLWVAAHEMVHVGFPGVGRDHRWASEGLATYVETVARTQAGELSPTELWELFTRRLPEGQPGPYDEGLDGTRSWARTYWGGALFWFLVDVEIGRATDGKKSLRDALSHLVSEGNNTSVHLPLVKALQLMDREVHSPVATSLYKQHAKRPTRVDLDALFTALGVARSGDAIVLDDLAQEAHIRRSIEGASADSRQHSPHGP